MGLSNDLISQFVKATKDTTETSKSTTVYGKVVKKDNATYVQLDGSDGRLTPISPTTTDIEDGDRVSVTIKNHIAVITGNFTSPSARTDTVKVIDGKVETNAQKIKEFEIIIADKISVEELKAEVAKIEALEADNVTIKGKLEANEAEIGNLKTDKLDATTANLEFAKVGDLEATDAEIYNLKGTYAEFVDLTTEKFEAAEANIEKLNTEKLSVGDADIKYADIDELDAANAKITNLESDYGNFKNLTAENFKAVNANIENADLKYANIDFSNIGKATMEYFYAQSGLIKDVTVGDQTITGHLVGVTISGDLIEGNTIKAEKLVIKGSDGLYYQLNTDGMVTEAEQTDQNSLNGSIIRAKSITASKISVTDLVAFGATIGGFHITDNSIFSGVKETVGNNTRGIYLDNDGQIAFGDSSNFVKFYKNASGNYKLAIAADELLLEGSNISSEVSSLKSKVQWVTDVWVDATAYDQSLWIPFKGNGLPLEHSARISVTAALNNNCHPSWATHGSGFSVEFEVEDIGNGWGANTWNQRILADKFNWCNTSPVSYTQLGYGSIPVLYLRGGGKYRVMTSYECNWTGYPDGYTWTSGEYSQSAPTHTSRPTPSGTNLYSDMAEAKSKISQQADSITGVVAKANKNESDIASLKLTSDSFTVRFDTVEGNVDDAIDKATQAQESFDNLEVGGRNYLTNAKRLNNWSLLPGTSGTCDRNHSECPNGVYLVGASDGSTRYRLSNAITSNGYWTVSFEIKGSQSTPVGFIMDICDLERTLIRSNASNTWEKRSLTVNVTNYTSDIYHFVDFENIDWAYIFVRNLKIEKGTKATDWTPAPEDVDNAIGTAQSTADTAAQNAANAQASANNAQTAANKAQNDINNLSIGGRNLVHNSNIFTAYGGATGVTGSVTSEGYLRIVASAGNQNWYNFSVGTIDTSELKQGDTFTLSFKMRSPDATKIPTIYLASGMGYWSMNGALSSEWSTVWCTQQWQSGLTINWHLGFSGCVGTYEIKNVKIEKGNRPTDWSPSPTNYMTFKKNVGLIIGNLTSGVDDLSKIGKNVRIDSDSVDICLGETVLASYGDNMISLGASSTSSMIDLCSGTGWIKGSPLDVGCEWWQLQLGAQNSIALMSEGEIIMTTDYSNGSAESHNVFSMGGDLPWNGDAMYSYGKWSISTTTAYDSMTSEIDMDHYGVRIQYYDRTGIWPEIRLDGDCIHINPQFTSTSAMKLSGDQRFAINNSRIWGTETDGTQVEVFQAKNSSNNTVIGWGNYSNGRGNTNIYGNDIYFNSAEAASDKAYRPYYRAGDTITVDLDTAGFVTSSARSVRFVVPLAKPIIGNPVITATSVNGITLRQGGQYTHGSSASTYAAVNSYSVTTTNDGNHVVVQAQINTTTNAVNNDSIGIRWSGKLTLSSSTQNVG